MEDQLEQIVTLAELQLDYVARLVELDEETREVKDRLRQVSERELPDAMDEAGVEGFTLKDGRKVSIKVEYYASIPKDKQPLAFSWLRERGHDGLIKRNVTAKFGKGEDGLAEAFVAWAREHYFVPIDDKQSVHHQTLKAFVREQMEDGIEIPQDVFGVHVRNVAKIGIK